MPTQKPNSEPAGFVVDVRTDDPYGRFAPGTALRARARDKTERTLVIDSMREHGGRLLVRIDGVASRDAADALRGSLFIVDTADAPEFAAQSPELFRSFILEWPFQDFVQSPNQTGKIALPARTAFDPIPKFADNRPARRMKHFGASTIVEVVGFKKSLKRSILSLKRVQFFFLQPSHCYWTVLPSLRTICSPAYRIPFPL